MQLDEMHVALVSLAVHLLGGENTLCLKSRKNMALFWIVSVAMGKDGTSPRSGNFTPNFVKS